jgi:hypothetical protein
MVLCGESGWLEKKQFSKKRLLIRMYNICFDYSSFDVVLRQMMETIK